MISPSAINAARLAVLVCLYSCTVQAADILWDLPQDISGQLSDFSTNGVFHEGYSGDSVSRIVTPGGLPLTFASSNNLSQGHFNADPATRAESSYDALLQVATWSTTPSSINLGLQNALSLGFEYEVQIWLADTRSCCAGRQKTYGDGSGSHVTLNSGTQSGSNSDFVIGTFVADATTQGLSFIGGGGSDHPQYNAIMVRELGLAAISSFTATPSIIAPSDSVSLNWEVNPAIAGLNIDSGIGNVLPLTTNGVGSTVINPGPTSTATYTMTASLADGSSRSATVTTNVDPSPRIISFTSDIDNVPPGTTGALNWTVANFETLTLDGIEIDPSTNSIPIAPLVTTTYILHAVNANGSDTKHVTITVDNSPSRIAATGRFIEVVKNDTTDTRLHISEIEAFAFESLPDEAHTDGTSSNDLVQAGSPSTQTPPTTTTLEHGSASSVFDGNLESGASVWSTASGQSVEPRYMLDLGTTADIGIVRVFGRADTCCANRLENFTINVYADDGTGLPGDLVNSAHFPDTAPSGNDLPVELDLSVESPGITSFVVDKSLISPAAPVTLSWTVSPDTTSSTINHGIGDVTALTNPDGTGSFSIDPGPITETTYLLTANRSNGASYATVHVDVTNQPLIYDFTASAVIVAPSEAVTLSWNTDNTTSLNLNATNVSGTTSLIVNPSATTTYTLTATNANGSVSEEITLRVALPGEPIISEFLASNEDGLLDEDGDASDWIELHNPTPDSISLLGHYLADDASNLTKWAFPDITLAGGGYLVVFASGKHRTVAGANLHSNFSLDAKGEYLALVKPDGTTIITQFSPTFPAQRNDVSYGLDDSTNSDRYFTQPTSGEANATGFAGLVADTQFSVDRGIYEAPFAVTITSATAGAEIRYTLDGTKPTATTGHAYSAPLSIVETTVLRAAAFKDEFVPTNVDTHTYIFPDDVIAHPNMDTNITLDTTYGPQMDASLRSVPSISLSFLGDVERTEKEVSLELINFESGHTQVDAGMVRFGSYVTNFAKRGMRLSFRKQFGPSKLKFPVFEGHNYNTFAPASRVDGIDLRAGNHDMSSRGAYMSNRFADDSMLDMGHISAHGRFVHVYLNGLYWGQYHLRERWNGAMLAEYFEGTKDNYEAINANNAGNQFLTGEIYDGSGEQWQATQTLIAGPNPFASARGHLDIPNVIDFMLLWVSGNSESEFRAAGAPQIGVPFKFFMKDADGWLRPPGHSVDHNGPLYAMLELASEGDPDYRLLLADRIHKHYFNDGAMTGDAMVERLQSRVDETQLSFLSEAARWGYRSPASWESYQTNLINHQLPGLTQTMISRFKSADMYPDIEAPTFSQHGGAVPSGYHLTITAPAGTIYYTLDGTDPRQAATPIGGGNGGGVAATASAYLGSIPINSNTVVKARVRTTAGEWSALNEATFFQGPDVLVVSEIMYNPSPSRPAEIAAGHTDGDDFEFLEILNTGADPYDLTGIGVRNGITFDFTDSAITTLVPGGRTVIVEDIAAFEFRYGPGHPIAGQYSGKLKDSGETLVFVDAEEETFRSFTYDDMAPWPTSPDGNGRSLILIDPTSSPDHDQAASWTASSILSGTPGGSEPTTQDYASWATELGVGAADADDDDDGLCNFLEFNLGSSPTLWSPDAFPESPDEYGQITITFTHSITAEGVTLNGETSTDLGAWLPAVVYHVLYHGDGTATTTLRASAPTAAERHFIRATFEE